MQISLNGASLQLPDATSVTALLVQQLLQDRRVAVEVNGDIVPRSQHDAHVLQADDRVEIVHALGGG